MVEKLNLPSYPFRIKNSENQRYIFDNLRKKFVVLTPEEWVRLHFVTYLITEKKYPASLIAIEKQLVINNRKKRTDILIFDKNGHPDIIVECKAPEVKITQHSFDQIARYNLKLNANYLIVTNGLNHYYCQLNHITESYVFLEDVPVYQGSDL